MRALFPIVAATAGVLVLCLLSAGCGKRAASPEALAEAARARQVQQAFVTEQQEWRDKRRASLVKPDGWSSLIGLHWIDAGSHYVGSAGGNGIRLSIGPAHLGMVDLKGDQLRFVPEKGVAVTLDGAPLKGATRLLADADEAGPSKLGFDDGKGLATVIKRGDRYALRVKHADAPTRLGFGALDYWPADSRWVITGTFVPHPAGKTMPIASIIGTTDEMSNPGVIEFSHAGKPYRIEALDEGEGTLFLVFADRTSGHGSYGAGRFIDAPMPDKQGHVRIDFNRAYNPPCAFTPFATCPLPPPENRLDLAIDAGEKTYHHTSP